MNELQLHEIMLQTYVLYRQYVIFVKLKNKKAIYIVWGYTTSRQILLPLWPHTNTGFSKKQAV